MSLYNSRSTSEVEFPGVLVTRFDKDLNPEVTYEVTAKSCSCPAGWDKTCKHRKKFQTFVDICNTDKFWDDEHKRIVTLEELKCE